MSKPSISHAVVSRESHMMLVCKLASSGNAAALALLQSPPAMAQDYIGYAHKQAKNHKLDFVDIIAVLTDDETDSLRKQLPKDSHELTQFKAALAEVKSSIPLEFTLHAAGDMVIGKDPSKCAMIVCYYTEDGKRTKMMFGLKKWRVLSSLSAADLSQLQALLLQASREGMK